MIVGEGQADYLPTMDGDVAQVEAGPQGPHVRDHLSSRWALKALKAHKASAEHLPARVCKDPQAYKV